MTYAARDPKEHDRYGCHRVVRPLGALPQAAELLDSDPTKRFDSELHIEVDTVNVDSASFAQIEAEQGADAGRMGARIFEWVRSQGKLQNPATGSGGMLCGQVSWIGPQSGPFEVAVGDRVATLVSLTLTPLQLRRIKAVRREAHQLEVEGTAILFASGMLVKLPSDIPERLALAALDVAGAAPQVTRLAGHSPGGSVLILGVGGKSGLLCATSARRAVGAAGTVVGVERFPQAADAARQLNQCDAVICADAGDPVVTLREALTAGARNVQEAGGYDLVVSCVNLPGAEMTAILAARERGRVYFFSMATSFQRAALGAEGVSKDIDMLIGNGYCAGHAEATLALLREEPRLLQELSRRYG